MAHTPTPTPSTRQATPQRPLLRLAQLDGPAQFAAQQAADFAASVRDIPSLNPLAGITSGPGNQGSACPSQLMGHAGTSGTFIGLPRELAAPGSFGGTPQ